MSGISGQRVLPLKEIIVDPALQIRESLDRETIGYYAEVFAQLPPVTVIGVDGKLYLSDGFHRYAAATRLGLKEVPAVVKEGSYQDALILALTANSKHGKNLTRKDRRRATELMLKIFTERADNWIANEVGINHSTVRRVREELEARGEIPKVDSVLRKDGIATSREHTIAKLAIEPEPDPWEGKVICGDAFEVLMDEPQIYDLIFIDPPYNISDEEWDSFSTPESFLDFTRQWMRLIVPLLKSSGRLFVCWSERYLTELKPIVDEISRIYPLNFGNIIIWHYPNTFNKKYDPHSFKPTYEPIFYWYGLEAPPLAWDSAWSEETRGNVWRISTPQSNYNEGKQHPSQKPLGLLERIVKIGSAAGDLVLDPFAGSGTTAIAAYMLGRQFKVVERDPKCCQVIRSRLESVLRR